MIPALARGEPDEAHVADLIAIGVQREPVPGLAFHARVVDAASVSISFPDPEVIDIFLEDAAQRAQQALSSPAAKQWRSAATGGSRVRSDLQFPGAV
jgi:hypothetical protein